MILVGDRFGFFIAETCKWHTMAVTKARTDDVTNDYTAVNYMQVWRYNQERLKTKSFSRMQQYHQLQNAIQQAY